MIDSLPEQGAILHYKTIDERVIEEISLDSIYKTDKNTIHIL